MTQTELAEAVGVSSHAIGRIETGATWPDYSTVQAIAGALKCKETDLVSDSGSSSSLEIMEKLSDIENTLKKLTGERTGRFTSEQAELIGAINDLDPAAISVLLGQARHLGNKAKTRATARKAK